MGRGLEVNLIVPDLWQQEAIRHLREGRDVIVQAPTGAGKTYIFELHYPSLKGQAIFTVPTRALANDKLAEWRKRGWDVGIATGDLAINTGAKVVVATLETQRARFLRREGPRLLVVDEYQMIADPVRGVHYELALSLAPLETQLLLLSGSVTNPQDIVAWLQRIGRDAVLVSHNERPVPLQNVDLQTLPDSAFVQGRSFWARMIGRALRAELAPVLVFAPRRKAAEEMAQAIASAVATREPLTLSPQQEQLAGKRLTKMLRNRVAYHHSGLSYAARAGVIEPLAKTAQLDVVVATMGLAAGINFSMRSVLVTGTRYLAGNFEREVQPDELLQMFGRAGRRGLDDNGYVLLLPDLPRLADARPRQLKRATQVDWPSLIGVMHNAVAEPFAAAVELSHSLFSTQKVPLGVEHSLASGPRPCGLLVDDERARFVRRPVVEMLNSADEWELKTGATTVTRGDLLVREAESWRPALSVPAMLDGLGFGNLCRLPERRIYGREIPIATIQADGSSVPVKWFRRALTRESEPGGRGSHRAAENAANTSGSAGASPSRPRAHLSREEIEQRAREQIAALTGGCVDEFVTRGNAISARVDFSGLPVDAWIDSLGRALYTPPERQNIPAVCRGCDQLEHDRTVAIIASPAYAWRRLGLIEADGTPTRRGILFSFFQAGEGLAIAAALEEESYDIEDLIFDIANLRAGNRFAVEDAPLGGRVGALCQRIYERADYPGYLEMGVPIHYGSGASEVVREVIANPSLRYKHVTESLRSGDIERAVIEWRSLLRHVAHAPDLDCERWRELKAAATHYVENSSSPALLDLPPLLAAQQRRAKELIQPQRS